ncbi:alpha/beta hydrolase [Fulvimarina sp. 2208YS6-2-32]|uniref:Palmitoyl-protein thioesterase ABHD10, mitochondrial n=1 Tax=Fulvimarina uroteuthidis TaxID=3098149 RepID=A0ABU5I5L5_9HYPH|nr:alpha/beta hydrolase [Fulvimarina sp. 2208YS6-2-32]MDY8109446.1 alpha/beta hydrolase [Fulvimarina sp. 2208YS6-2-32]
MQDATRDVGHEITVGRADEARRIAYRTLDGTGPTIVWLGGYRSDMRGTKAEHLLAMAGAAGRGFLRLDYSGHGESGGRFEDGTISRWTQEAKAAIEAAGAESVVLVGSSMGAWIALRLVALARHETCNFSVEGLMLLAPAPDFTERLMRPKLTDADLQALRTHGYITEASDYSEQPNIYTRALFEDGANNLVMAETIETGCPIAILQGMADPDVPYTHALDLMERLPSDNVTMTLVRDGDHRLSRPQDLALIERLLTDLLSNIDQSRISASTPQ